MFVGLTVLHFFVGVGSGSSSDTSRGDFRILSWVGSTVGGLGGTQYGHLMGQPTLT